MIKIDLLNGIQKALCIKEKLGNLTLKIKTFPHKMSYSKEKSDLRWDNLSVIYLFNRFISIKIQNDFKLIIKRETN